MITRHKQAKLARDVNLQAKERIQSLSQNGYGDGIKRSVQASYPLCTKQYCNLSGPVLKTILAAH